MGAVIEFNSQFDTEKITSYFSSNYNVPRRITNLLFDAMWIELHIENHKNAKIHSSN